jgi:hypothetical protein
VRVFSVHFDWNVGVLCESRCCSRWQQKELIDCDLTEKKTLLFQRSNERRGRGERQLRTEQKCSP